MKYLLLLLLGLTACRLAEAKPSHVTAAGPHDYVGIIAPGDTLRYALTWNAVGGASGYLVRVTASRTNGVWTGLPAGITTTATSLSFAASALSWDSVTFTAVVKATSPTRSSKDSLVGTWRVLRYLAAPTSLNVDSTLIGPLSFLIFPSQTQVMVGQTIQLCPAWRFGSGHIALRSMDQPICGLQYAAQFAASQRAVTLLEQAWWDNACDPWAACLLGLVPMPRDMLPTRRA